MSSFLVLDDNQEILDIIGMFFNSLDMPHSLYSNSFEVLAKYRKDPSCNLILDCSLPGDIGGVEIRDILIKEGFSPKILFITGYSKDFFEGVSKDNSFQVLTKPFTFSQFKKALDFFKGSGNE